MTLGVSILESWKVNKGTSSRLEVCRLEVWRANEAGRFLCWKVRERMKAGPGGWRFLCWTLRCELTPLQPPCSRTLCGKELRKAAGVEV